MTVAGYAWIIFVSAFSVAMIVLVVAVALIALKRGYWWGD